MKIKTKSKKSVSFHPNTNFKENIADRMWKRKYLEETGERSCDKHAGKKRFNERVMEEQMALSQESNLYLNRWIEHNLKHSHTEPPSPAGQRFGQTTCIFINLPKDPREWSREDVSNWLSYMKNTHGIPELQTERFQMNGKALCLMSMEMFIYRVPSAGKMLYRDFRVRLSSALTMTGQS